MQIHELQPKTKSRSAKRVGRGGKRGKTSGRGTKGQKAQSGHSIRPEIRDTIKKLPKRRGYGKNRARTVNDARVTSAVVNLADLETHFSSGESVTPSTLKSRGLVRARKNDRALEVKILGNGTLSKKLSCAKCKVSKRAKEQIEKMGGDVV